MAAENGNIYNSGGNASISTKFSGMIPLVILSHFDLSESRSHDWRPSWIFLENAISGHFEGLWLVAVAFHAIVCALGTLYALGTLILALGTLHRPIFGCSQHLVVVVVFEITYVFAFDHQLCVSQQQICTIHTLEHVQLAQNVSQDKSQVT